MRATERYGLLIELERIEIMLPYLIEEIDANVLNQICKQRFSESSTIDFKEELTKNTDQGKNELAKDVCAFANADGGDLVFGIKEEKDSGTAHCVVPLDGESFDEALRRLLQTLEAWVEPRIQGIQFQNVPIDGGFVLVLRVPASFDGPHCTRNNNSQRRFVIRNGTITSDMSYDQLRTAFDRTASLADEARKFIASRMQLVQAQKTWRPMDDGPVAIVELTPLSGLAGRKPIDIKTVEYSSLIFWDSGGSSVLNLDGLIAYSEGTKGIWGMTQMYRNGCIEAVRVVGGIDNSGKTGIWCEDVIAFYATSINSTLTLWKKLGIQGPALVQCGLLHTNSGVLSTDQLSSFSTRKMADRPHMVFPEIWIEDLSSASDADQLLLSTVEVLWQSFGYFGPPSARR